MTEFEHFVNTCLHYLTIANFYLFVKFSLQINNFPFSNFHFPLKKPHHPSFPSIWRGSLSVSGANLTIFHFPFSIFHLKNRTTLIPLHLEGKLIRERSELNNFPFSIFHFPFSIINHHLLNF